MNYEKKLVVFLKLLLYVIKTHCKSIKLENKKKFKIKKKMNNQLSENNLHFSNNKKTSIFNIHKTKSLKTDLILSHEYNRQNLIINSNKNKLNEKSIEENESKLSNLIMINENKNILNQESHIIEKAFAMNVIPYKKKQKLTKKNIWTIEEDRKLSDLISIHGKKSWKEISNYFTNKSRKQCFLRWRSVLSKKENNSNSNLKFGSYRINNNKINDSIKTSTNDDKNLMFPKNSEYKNESHKTWSQNEDEIIIRWVSIMGNKNWTKCSKLLIYKSPKDCKDRWFNKLAYENNNLENSDYWNKKDEILLLLFIRKFGPCWSKLAKLLDNKTGNQIKNKFNCLARLAFKADSKSIINGNSYEIENVNESKKTENDFFTNTYCEENKAIKEKAEKIISFLVNSSDEYIYEQNVKIFCEAKKCFNEKYADIIYGKNDSLNNCVNHHMNNVKSTENNHNLSQECNENNFIHDCKRLNVCNGCLVNLRNNIKRKIIMRIKSSNINPQKLKDLLIQNSMNKKENYSNSINKYCMISKPDLNNSKEININLSSDSNKIEILNKIPQLFELINTLKAKIVN